MDVKAFTQQTASTFITPMQAANLEELGIGVRVIITQGFSLCNLYFLAL